jgi:hypothetical protein
MPPFLDAAYLILTETRRPMSADEIMALALARNLVHTRGSTPSKSLAAQLYVDIRSNGAQSRFVQVGRGANFALNDVRIDTHLAVAEITPRYRQKQAKRDAPANKKVSRYYMAFLDQLESQLATILPADVKTHQFKTVRRGNLLQWHPTAMGACHYEVRLARDYHEIGLHFEGNPDRNELRRQAFEPHLDELSAQLNQSVRADPWKNWARVWIKLPLVPPSSALADQYAGWLARFIEVTLPILESTVPARKTPRAKPQPVVPVQDSGYHAALDREVGAIQSFLQGRSDQRPSDEKLCDWVQLCYILELYAAARDLFRLINPTDVHPWYFERTKKLARICTIRADSYA